MVQSINTKALLTLASVLRRPGLLVPQVSVSTISQVNYTALKEQGIAAIMFDKDNTLTAPYENTIHPLAAKGIDDALRVFGRGRVAILSNSAGTKDDPDYEDALLIETSLGINVIRHDEKKPGGLDEVLRHFQLSDPAELCMVGDRLLTDIVFGNLHGMLTVHCLPLCSGTGNGRDNWTAKIIRPVENNLLYGRVGSSLLKRRRYAHKLWLGEEACPLVLPAEDDDIAPPTSRKA
jgi:phosphatidylglycerophosphatase GEP4